MHPVTAIELTKLTYFGSTIVIGMLEDVLITAGTGTDNIHILSDNLKSSYIKH